MTFVQRASLPCLDTAVKIIFTQAQARATSEKGDSQRVAKWPFVEHQSQVLGSSFRLSIGFKHRNIVVSCIFVYCQSWISQNPVQSMMSWNLTSKKSSTDTEHGVWKLLSCSFTYQSEKIRFRSPCEKNHKTSLSKVKSLNGQFFYNNK